MNFDLAFEIIIGHEGGYVNDPRDPGGETRYGISKRAYPNEDINNPDAYSQQVPLPPTGFVEPEPIEPTVVSMSQCRIALLQYGLLDEVDAYFVEQAKTGGESGRASAIEWEYSTVVVQGAPLVNQVQAAFGWTDDFMDELFALAKTL